MNEGVLVSSMECLNGLFFFNMRLGFYYVVSKIQRNRELLSCGLWL